jgi:uncharacterized membrane protein
MAHPNRIQRIRFLFRVGILLKGIDGFMELIGGLVLLSLAREFLSRTVALVTAHELSEDPHDLLANALTHTVSLLSADTRRFAGAYLVGHGCIKIVLVAGLWREKRWAYPFALWFLGAFVVYQLYRFAHTHSLVLLAFTALDVFILWAIWRDYRLRRGLTG